MSTTPDDAFFLYYCSQAVHIPHTPAKELDGVKIAGTTPGLHGDMIRELDVQVGMLVKALKKVGIYDNTLFIFTSDNGGLSWDPGMKEAGHDTSNGLNGSKGSVFEGGHRVPFVAVWPGKIQPDVESDVSIVGHDVVATIAALAGQTISRDVVMDSVNLLPIFLGQARGDHHQYLMHQSKGGPYYALRQGEWKLIMKGEKPNDMANLTPFKLFNLSKNLGEDDTYNLVGNPEYKPRVDAMFTKYRELRASGAPTVSTAD